MRNGLKLSFGATLVTFLGGLLFIGGCASSTAAPTPTPTPIAVKAVTFANPDLLVDTNWLAQHLGDANIRIVDTRTADEYKAGHIKGAVSLPVDDTFNPVGPKQMAGPPEQIERLFGEKGISNDTKVIVYDNGKETKAPRILWTLEYYGHSKAAVLDGGFKKWQKENLSVTPEETKVASAKFTAKTVPSRLAGKDDILVALKKPTVAIVDARSKEEYRGDDLRTKRGGHVPGAVNLDWRDLFTSDEVPSLKSPSDLKKLYEEAGVTKDKDVFAYCQTGQRSSVTYLTLRLLGYDKLHNYDGSWQEWGNETDTPIEK